MGMAKACFTLSVKVFSVGLVTTTIVELFTFTKKVKLKDLYDNNYP